MFGRGNLGSVCGLITRSGVSSAPGAWAVSDGPNRKSSKDSHAGGEDARDQIKHVAITHNTTNSIPGRRQSIVV